MSYAPPKRSVPVSPKKPHSDFSWPPTDEQLAHNFDESAFEGMNPTMAEPPTGADPSTALVAPEEPFLVPDESLWQVPNPAIGREQQVPPMPPDPEPAAARDREAAIFESLDAELSESPFLEPRYEAFDSRPGEEGSTLSDGEDASHSGNEHSTTSEVAMAERESALDTTSVGDWAGEIAHLQALIEGLTQKLDVSTRAHG